MATYYWVGGNGTWDNANTANWAVLSGGPGGFGPPLAADIVFFDSLSGTGTCTTAVGATCLGVVAFNTSTLGLTLGANLTMSSSFTLTLGALNLGSSTLSCSQFISSNANVRSIAFGTGAIELTGNNLVALTMNNVTNYTYTGTPTINATYAGGTGTRTINFGSGGGATEANAPNLSITAGTDTVTIQSTGTAYKNLNFTGFAGSLTFGLFFVYGNLTVSSGMTLPSTTSSIFFSATSGTQQITTNGKTLDFPLTQNSPGATVQLQDNLTMGSTRTYTLTNGTLDLSSGNRTLSTGLFASNNSNVRSIAFGTGNITVTGNAATIWTTATGTNLSFTGTPTVNATYSGGTGTRTFSTPGIEAVAININVTAGTDTLSLANFVKSLDLTGFAGNFPQSANIVFYGGLKLSSGTTLTGSGATYTFTNTASASYNIDTANKTLDVNLSINSAGATYTLVGNLTTGATRVLTLTIGTINLANNILTVGTFSSTNSNARSIAFGTGSLNISGNAGTIWNAPNSTNLTYTGTPTVNLNYSGAVGTRTISAAGSSGGLETTAFNFNVTAGTDIFVFVSAANVRNVDFTGFAGTWTNAASSIYGNLTVSSGMTVSAGAGTITFASTSSGKTITTNAKTFDFPLTFNGIGGVWAFQDALTQGSTRAFTITNGTVQLKDGVTSTVGSFVANNTAVKFLQSTTLGSQATLSQASGTVNVADLTIRDINAVGGASWNAYTDFENTDAGNNDGWNFSLSPPYSVAELPITLRPFTQPRRF